MGRIYFLEALISKDSDLLLNLERGMQAQREPHVEIVGEGMFSLVRAMPRKVPFYPVP